MTFCTALLTEQMFHLHTSYICWSLLNLIFKFSYAQNIGEHLYVVA